MRTSSDAPPRSATVSTICSVATAPSSRRSPRLAVARDPFSPCRRSGSDARAAGSSPAIAAAITAAARPKARMGQPMFTASARGTACPAIALSSRTMPTAKAAPRSPPVTASTRLSVSVWRNRRHRPAPSAERMAYSAWRCRPRVSSSPATLAQAIRKTIATEPKSGISSRRPSRLSTSCTGRDARRDPLQRRLGLAPGRRPSPRSRSAPDRSTRRPGAARRAFRRRTSGASRRARCRTRNRPAR